MLFSIHTLCSRAYIQTLLMKTQGLIDYSINYVYLSTSVRDYRTCINFLSLYCTMIIDIVCLFLPYIQKKLSKHLNGTKTFYNACVNVVQLTQLAHYVFTTFQFGCSLVRLISYVKIVLSQHISEYLICQNFVVFCLRTIYLQI